MLKFQQEVKVSYKLLSQKIVRFIRAATKDHTIRNS